mmetsp:Transcript_6720/g.9069  ORF Transcript_6720/g.9069 Transcript_6720/m.9069 type:complete len:207 (-) Transcript_6720:297-917(-)
MTVLMPLNCCRSIIPQPRKSARRVVLSLNISTTRVRDEAQLFLPRVVNRSLPDISIDKLLPLISSISSSSIDASVASPSIISTISSCASRSVSRNVRRTSSAAPLFPAITSQRGDSGKERNPINMIMLGTAARPSINLHPPSLKNWSNNPSTIPALNCPKHMRRPLIVTRVPLIDGVAISATYIGVVNDAMPIPTPTTTRPNMREP